MVLAIIAGGLAAAALLLWYLPRKQRLVLKLAARIPAGVLICAALLTLLAFLFPLPFRGAMCNWYEFPPISSSDGKQFAQLNEVDCGAPDDDHSFVQLWSERQGFLARIFGKRGYATTVMTVGDDPRLIDVAWQDNRTLIIRYPSDYSQYGEKYRCQAKSGDIRIECVGYMPDYSKPLADMPPVRRWPW
jgi:hypothetical protein